MAFNPNLDIDHVADLARLALTPDEKVAFSRQLGDVLAYIEQLKQVDVSRVEATAHVFPLHNVWAEDAPEAALPVEAALRNAPARRENMIAVPVVVE